MKNGKRAWKGLKRIAKKVGSGTKKAYIKSKPVVSSTYKGSVSAARRVAKDIKSVRQAGSIHLPRKTVKIKKIKGGNRGKGSAYISGWKQVPRKVGGKWKVEKVPIIKYRRGKIKVKKRKIKRVASKTTQMKDPFDFDWS